MKVKKPNIGDIITHKEPAFRRENTGKVIELLGMQFIYETKEGHQRHCNYTELWQVSDNR